MMAKRSGYRYRRGKKEGRVIAEKRNNNLVIISSIFLVLLIIAFISLVVVPNISSTEESINSPSQASQATTGVESNVEDMSQTLAEIEQVFK